MYFNPVDIEAFFGNPPTMEDSAQIINDIRKRLRLQTNLANAPDIQPTEVPMEGQNDPVEQVLQPEGGALAFNETQLMNELSGLKKGSGFGTLAATIIPALIQYAPQIIDAIKGVKKEGSAIKFGGASAVFLNGVKPEDYDDYMDLMKKIQRQSKFVVKTGSGYCAGSGKVGDFFKSSWAKLKKFYGDNADKLKPITDILMNSAKNQVSKYVDKGTKYIADKTGSETLGQIANIVGDTVKDSANTMIKNVGTYGRTEAETKGSGFVGTHLDNESTVRRVKKSRKTVKKLNVSINPEQPVTVIKARKLVY